MSVDACAAMVARADPDRFASAMTAPLAARGDLMVLYAFNLEVAKAPWVTSEPMLAEMRLQWWADALEEIAQGKPARAHEVATPLAALINDRSLDPAPLAELIEARRADIHPDPPVNLDTLWVYLESTAGGLMQTAARALGATEGQAARARLFGTCTGAANLIVATPALLAAKQHPLPETGPNGLRVLATRALDHLTKATVPKHIRPAFLAGWQTRRLLCLARKSPETILAGQTPSEFTKRLSLIRTTLTGRF